MPTKQFPTDILTQAIDVQEAWSQIDNELAFGNVNVPALVTDIAQIRSLEHTVSSLESQLTEVRNRREAACQSAWDKVKRVRAGIKANFGDDSSQYEMIGGTRVSDRKPVRRTATPVQ
jgi:hypothetical protein